MNQPLDSVALAAMKRIAVVNRDSFAAAVAIAARPVSKRNSIPVLCNVLICGDGGAVTITGTDLDAEIKVTVPCPADERFATTVPAHMLKDILAKARASDMVSLEHGADEDSPCTVDLGGVTFDLKTRPHVDFPDLSVPEFLGGFTLPATDLAAMLDKVFFAVSTEETRYYLNGVYLHHHPETGCLRAVATDGHRLAVMASPAPDGSAALPGVIVPRATVKLLLDTMKELRKGRKALPEVFVEIGKGVPTRPGEDERYHNPVSRIRFTMGAVTITSKLIDGTFPDYQRVLPKDQTLTCRGQVKAFDSAVEQVSLIHDNGARAVKLSFAAGACTVTVDNPDAGTASATVPAEWSNGLLDIGFNAGYLRGLLAEMTGDAFAAHFTDSGSPVTFTDPDEPRWSAVLMPLRV